MEDELEPMGQLAAHLDRGWDLVAKGDLRRATMSAEKSLELDETSPEAHNLLGYIAQAEGQDEDALEHYRHALELDEGYVDAMLNAADVLVRLKDHDGALSMVHEALDWLQEDEIDERTDAMLVELDIHLFRGEAEAAASVARDLPTGPFENPGLVLHVGRAKLDTGDLDGAEPLVLEAIAQQPPSSDAFYYHGLIREQRDDPRGTLLAFLQARELDARTPPMPWSLPREQLEQRVQAVFAGLPADLTKVLEGALVVVTDLPGAEIVADGVDPRLPVLLDVPAEEAEAPTRVVRVFLAQRNIERVAAGVLEIDEEIRRALEAELRATFPHLAAEDAPPPPEEG